MNRFAIINNRKRAIIALVHSLFFLAVAAVQLAISRALPLSMHGERLTGGVLLLAIYAVVVAVLLVLFRLSACTHEKLYFALCAASAGFGLVRIVLGDPALHANVLRVVLLLCAVIVGNGILRIHSMKAASEQIEFES
jgi:hypothetical protein